MKKILILILVYMLPCYIFGQFTTNTPSITPENCNGDGKVGIGIANATAGSTFDYLLQRLSGSGTFNDRNGSLGITSQTAFTLTQSNLPAGSYTIRIRENIAGNLTTKNVSFTISNNYSPLQFNSIVSYTCSGNITVNVTQGQPSTYELRNPTNGAVVVPAQSSNSFTGLAAGNYNVAVTDQCGNTKVIGATITDTNTDLYFASTSQNLSGFDYLYDCSHILHKIDIRMFGFTASVPNYKYPINVTYEINIQDGSPTGTTYIRNYVLNSSADNGMVVHDIPYIYGKSFTIKKTLTDACGITKNYQSTYNNPLISMDVRKSAASCGNGFITINNILYAAPNYSLEFISYPAGFQPWNYNTNFTNGSYIASISGTPPITINIGSNTNPVPSGNYTIRLKDSCGNAVEKTVNIVTGLVMNRYYAPGCGSTIGSVTLFPVDATNSTSNTSSATPTGIKVISGPAGFSSTYPKSFGSEVVASNNQIYLGNLPPGTYNVEIPTTCGLTITGSFVISGAVYSFTPSTQNSCSSFNYNVSLSGNNTNSASITLQKLNSTNNTWQTVQTATANISGNISTTFSNIQSGGDFRTLLQYYTYETGKAAPKQCTEILDTFTAIPGGLTLSDYYVFSCPDGTYNLVLYAQGITPLKYKLVEKDGIPINIDNNTNPVFTNLSAGKYKAQVIDNCGNTINVNVLVSENKLPKIKPGKLCQGQPGNLILEGMSFATIKWYKNGVDTGVTGVQYPFNPFNSATDTALYEAKISYPGSCINTSAFLDLNSLSINSPNAGTGQTVTLSINNLSGPVDLFSYLTAPYNTNGIWTDNNNTGYLIENKWYAQYATEGTYTFDYTVNGLCNNTAKTTVTIILNSACYKPAVTNGTSIPTSFGITSLGRAGTNQDNWPMIRQSGFMVLESKTKGFVINRLNTLQINAITAAGNAVDGMMIYDTDQNCLKIYVEDPNNAANSKWKCFNKPGCTD